MADTEKKTVSFRYKISPNYTTYWAVGVIGGPTVYGPIVVNFYSERTSIPKIQSFTLNEQGALGEVESEEKEDAIIRDVLFGVALSPDVARAIGQWLIRRADAATDIDEGVETS